MKKVLSIIICALLVLSIIGNVYLYIQNGDINLSLENSQSELSSVQTTLSKKETELSDANTKITELEGTVTDLQNQITDLEKELKELKDKFATAEKEKADTEKKAAEEKAAEEAKANAKASKSSTSAQNTYEEWDITGYDFGDDVEIGVGFGDVENLGEYDDSGAVGGFEGVEIY